MNDDTQKIPADTTTQPQESESGLSRASATLGIIADVLFFIPLIVRIFMWGLPNALDLGHMSPMMAIGVWLAIIGLILSIVAMFRKGRKRLAKIGIYTSCIVILVILLLPAL